MRRSPAPWPRAWPAPGRQGMPESAIVEARNAAKIIDGG